MGVELAEKNSMNDHKGKNKQKKYKVFIVDDHPIVREGLIRLINRQNDLVVCGEAEDIPDAIQTVVDSDPDIAIIDLMLRRGSGIRLIENFMYSLPDLPILVLSMHDESLYAERCLRAGARGYIMKHESPTELLYAIRTILKGELYLGEELGKNILYKLVRGRLVDPDSPVDILSTREMEVYQLIGRGLKKREIAERLNLSDKTVATYVEHIKKKMKFKDFHELLFNAVEFVRNSI